MNIDLSKLPVSSLPLLFTYVDLISGRGFIAGVRVRGRVLAEVVDEGNVIFCGVSPGGIATGTPACTMAEGNAAFRNEYTAVLRDIAESVSTFDAFKAEVEAFINDTSDELMDAWQRAIMAARDAKLTSFHVGLPFLADPGTSISIENVTPQSATPEINAADETVVAAEAPAA